MTRFTLAFALFSIAAPGLLAQGGRRLDRRTPEQRKIQMIAEVSQRMSRLSSRPELLTQENRALAQKVSALLERSRQSPAGSYSLDRLESAMDDLLDAGEEILESRSEPRDRQGNRDSQPDADEARRSTARDLERSYFRIQQGDYFARAAYDVSDFRGARGLSDASQKVIDALESLAQAAVPIPEPPRLPEN